MLLTILGAIEIGAWLLEQAPVIVLMGVVIVWLAKRLSKSEREKDELAKDVIKLATLWEEKSDKLEENSERTKEQILEFLRDIKMLVKNIIDKINNGQNV
jgi:uncharacterized protein YgfB (UPF0149 family)